LVLIQLTCPGGTLPLLPGGFNPRPRGQGMRSHYEIKKSKIISCFGGDNLRNICIGKLTENEYFQKIIDENKWEISIREMKKIVRNNFDIEIQDMPNFIYELSKHNSLILYSDHAREWVSYIKEKHSFLQFF
jgi:hypothetical protein